MAIIAVLVSVLSCTNHNGPDEQTTIQASESTSTPTGDPDFELPDLDLDGFTMTMLRSETYFTEHGVWADSDKTGDRVSEAVYKRNLKIEEKYKCTIALLKSNSDHPSSDIPLYVADDSGAVDVVFDGGGQIVKMLDYFYDLNKLAYFDFDKPWWNREFNEGVSIGGKLYLTIGSYMTDARQYIFHIIFDKAVADDLQISDSTFYQIVRDDQWTLDKMTEYAKLASKDVNGDGVFDTNDRYGFLGQVYLNWSLALGAGLHCVEKDKDDIPIDTLGSSRNFDVIDAVLKLTTDPTVTQYAERMTGVDNVWRKLRELETSNGMWLFLGGALGDYMRAVPDPGYGVLPSPKLDERQTRYYHDASLGNSPTTAIPICSNDPDKVSFILEAMSYYSYKEVLPEFYENYLNTKLVRDDDSIEMLQLIHNSLFYDVGALFGWGGMHSVVATMTDQNLLASRYDSIRETISAQMNDSVSMILKRID